MDTTDCCDSPTLSNDLVDLTNDDDGDEPTLKYDYKEKFHTLETACRSHVAALDREAVTPRKGMSHGSGTLEALLGFFGLKTLPDLRFDLVARPPRSARQLGAR